MIPNKPASELRQALGELSPYFRRAAWISLIASLLVLAPSAYMLEVYDRVVASRSHMTLWMLTLLVVGAFVVMEVLDWARGQLMHEASVALDQRLSSRVFTAIFEANLKRSPGGTILPMNDFRTLRDFLNTPVLIACMEAPVSLVFLLLIFAMNPLLGWTAVAAAILQTLIAWLNQRSTQPPLLAANRSAAAAQAYADGSLRNAQVIESMGMLRDIHQRWMAKQREFLKLQAQASDAGGAFQAASKFLQTTTGSALLGLGAWLVLRNELNGGSAMMIIASVLGGRVLAPLVQIVSQWQTVVNVRESWSRLDQLLATMPVRPAGMALPAPKGALVVEGLIASAPGTTVQILKGVAFELKAGEVLAVVGPSASGKTTLARLLAGFWPAISGKVRLDGVDVFTWDKAELGPHVGYLPQGVELFDGRKHRAIWRGGPGQGGGGSARRGAARDHHGLAQRLRQPGRAGWRHAVRWPAPARRLGPRNLRQPGVCGAGRAQFQPGRLWRRSTGQRHQPAKVPWHDVCHHDPPHQRAGGGRQDADFARRAKPGLWAA